MGVKAKHKIDQPSNSLAGTVDHSMGVFCLVLKTQSYTLVLDCRKKAHKEKELCCW